MNKNDSLGDRMKRYEAVYQTRLIPRSYTIIRIDGKAFHTFTSGLKKPFDKQLVNDMVKTARYLCENIQGCKLGYVQSDEISLLLTDFDTHETQAWFGNETQKMLSISASMATAIFNKLMWQLHFSKEGNKATISAAGDKLAHFDSRVFQVPNLSEVSNYFLWRQKDAIRNSIQACGQALYSQKQLHGVSTLAMTDLISAKSDEFAVKMKECGYDIGLVFNDTGQAWHALPESLKKGTVITKVFGEWAEQSFDFHYSWFELNIQNNI